MRAPTRIDAPWTLALGLALAVTNAEQFGSGDTIGALLQWDRDRIASGEQWRVVTGNAVHWSAAHVLLDLGAFLAIGLLCERHVGPRAYPLSLLTASVTVGLAVGFFEPEAASYRGLSGVASGQFAVCALSELSRLRPRRTVERSAAAAYRVWCVTAALFAFKVAYEIATGSMLFGTEGLGDIGVPLAVAHGAGVAGAVGAWTALRIKTRRVTPARARGPAAKSLRRRLASSRSIRSYCRPRRRAQFPCRRLRSRRDRGASP